MRSIIVILALVVSTTSFAETKQNVVLVTVDGVRFQEIFNGVQKRKAFLPKGTELLPLLKESVKKGEAHLYKNMVIANKRALSLPGYRSITTGDFEKECKENSCSNIDRETVFDYLADMGLGKNELGTFASWDQIGVAIESKPGRITRSIKMEEYVDPNFTAEEQAQVDEIHRNMTTNLPQWHGARFDKYTHDLAKIFIKKNQPRLTYISYLDPDEHAHAKNYNGYLKAIQDLDQRLADLRKFLDDMGEYGRNTSIVVTTDHGRPRGFLWTQHSREFPSAITVWGIVYPAPKLIEAKNYKVRKCLLYSHKDIRPTVETLMGVPVKGGKKKGKSLIELK